MEAKGGIVDDIEEYGQGEPSKSTFKLALTWFVFFWVSKQLFWKSIIAKKTDERDEDDDGLPPLCSANAANVVDIDRATYGESAVGAWVWHVALFLQEVILIVFCFQFF